MTGGLDGAGDMLDSTEVLAPSSSSSSAGWRVVAGLLPRAMFGVQVAALDNTLYCTGGETVSRHHSTTTSHPSILSSIIKKCNDDLYMLNNNLFNIDNVVIHKTIYFDFSGVLQYLCGMNHTIYFFT